MADSTRRKDGLDVLDRSSRISSAMDDAATEFVCAITQELPVDPVTAMDGHVYERSAIREWLATGNQRSPTTNQPMGSTLLPAHHVRNSLRLMIKSGALTGDKVVAWQMRLKAEESVEEHRRRAADGDARSMCKLGSWYERGRHGLTEDATEAARWYRRAADAGDPTGKAFLGASYLDGDGVAPSASLAFSLITEAAVGGSINACYWLGLALKNGEDGMPIDPRLAYKWWSKIPICLQEGGEAREHLLPNQEQEALAFVREHPEFALR